MVKIHVKKGDESQFLMETTVTQTVDDLFKEVAAVYNGRLKVMRICSGMSCLEMPCNCMTFLSYPETCQG